MYDPVVAITRQKRFTRTIHTHNTGNFALAINTPDIIVQSIVYRQEGEITMTDAYIESITDLLQRIRQTNAPHIDQSIITEMIECAHKASRLGANQFTEKLLENNNDILLANNLSLYPLAQVLLGIIQFHALNHDTHLIRPLITSLLNRLDEQNTPRTLH
ncbi:hypothetical protein CI610_02235 [invertebrate metagenome]|uniref:Uncharacterized protein n=1 Tax=invertebrate metagenome TaxID=1711999 RepID=A0A2H9T6J4_9ZZZZ